MRYGSVCSGIEAATAAWHPLGWEPAFFSEIEKFPRAVLEYHYPEVPLHGDFTTIGADDYGSIDLLVGGTPCQSFSVAGLRKGLDDDRGNLALEFLRLAERKRPKWLVWENVPGVLSSNGGRDFGSFLGGLVELGYGFSYRVFDAQFFGVPQRRRRVFVVGYLGDWRPAAAVLFERHSLQGHSAPSREKGEGITLDIAPSLRAQSQCSHRLDSEAYVAQPYKVANCLTARTAKGMNSTLDEGQTPVIVHGTQDPCVSEKAFALGRNNGGENVVAFAENSRQEVRLEGGDGQVAGALSTGGGKPGQGRPTILHEANVRRLTPIECERLQGFDDNFTRIPWSGKAPDECPDGHRYKALGNSMAVPVMAFIGNRIQMIEEIKCNKPN